MKQLTEKIYVGDLNDYNSIDKNDWAIVHACKDPSHKELVGYSGNLPPSHPDYSLKEVDNRLALNIVDMPNFSINYAEHHKNIFIYTIDFIDRKISKGENVLIHCNLGESRSPSIAMIYLASKGFFDYKNFLETEKEFKLLYPKYNPKGGIRGNIEYAWRYLVDKE